MLLFRVEGRITGRGECKRGKCCCSGLRVESQDDENAGGKCCCSGLRVESQDDENARGANAVVVSVVDVVVDDDDDDDDDDSDYVE